ncbi:hypothetical protein SLEP1_g10236 [Rubroshorea leprosula]|uniref:AAA+ ATPase domain-containing protein n=1 Tax=Rubroshorea leprosula TaxID=152421 RepID=A0AAV5I7G3_9ROSI|nr:hypothetical protein SLEP1_g10236 [Rubroshorea leprosula]
MRMLGGAALGALDLVVSKIMIFNFLFDKLIPSSIKGYIERYGQKIVNSLNPYIKISFDEFSGDRLRRNEAFSPIQHYLREKSSGSAKRLKAHVIKGWHSPIISMDYNEEVTDEFQGVKVWWTAVKHAPHQNTLLLSNSMEQRSYRLCFHKRCRELIIESYIKHVVEEGKAIAERNRKKRLYSNNPSEAGGRFSSNKWSNVAFEHPATFDTLAMEPEKKEKIKNELVKFRKGKEYYAKIGKAWKRGYLLYGPPGTGKSTMIAAMANLLDYDVYDLELTAVKDNTELKRLLIDTSNKSIMVIEDIDCSLDLTGQREKKKKLKKEEEEEDNENKEEGTNTVTEKAKEKKNKESKVTLSGLLNFIDGLWSACGEERIIVFTTNHINKLDPALIRRGRMDKHIEMSYCCFESFKVLAKNYLDIESHSLFGDISRLLEETNMTPADVAENLMPKLEKDDPDTCLKNLIEALSKEEAHLKAEKEKARLKAEKEEKEKEEALLKAQKEEKEKEEALLKAEKEEKEKEEALQKAKKEEQEKEGACQKVEKERKVKSNLLKRLLKKMNQQSKK